MSLNWMTREDLLKAMVDFGIGRIIRAKWTFSPEPDLFNEIMTPDEYKVAIMLSRQSYPTGVSDSEVVKSIEDAIADTRAEVWLKTNGIRLCAGRIYVNGPSLHAVTRI